VVAAAVAAAAAVAVAAEKPCVAAAGCGAWVEAAQSHPQSHLHRRRHLRTSDQWHDAT